jgi:glutathione S-transferase
MKLYWALDSGALAPHILLEEAGAEYELSVLDMENADESSQNYLKINPRGQVPAMVLEDGEIITESAAISLHIADSHPAAELIPPMGSSERARVYRWLFYAASNIYEGVLRFYYTERFTTDENQVDQVRESARLFIDYSWDLLEKELGQGPYLLGDTYSLVDPYLLMLTNWHDQPENLFTNNPLLKRLCDAVKARPAVQRIWSQHFPDEG